MSIQDKRYDLRISIP